MPIKIAFVDDEDQILRALRRLFFGTDYQCVYFNKPKALIEYLETESIDLLITDIRMPEMDGIELMRQVKAMKPEVIRVALSGYTDSRQILTALDSGLARLYIYKPWDNDELKKLIEGLAVMMHQLRQSHLIQTINEMGSLPTYQKLYKRVVNLIESDASAFEIAQAIETDPAIASKLLRIANTVFYGSHTGSVQQAIMLLGLTNVRQIILTNAIFDSAKQLPYGQKLWQHAAITNKGVAYLYQLRNKKSIPPQAGVVGLMHTMGLLFLATMKVKAYGQLLEGVKQNLAKGNPFAFDTLELEVFGATHCEVGLYLLNWWELPFDIIESATHYRNPKIEEIGNTELVAIVHLVSYHVFKQLELECFQFPLNEAFLGKVGITLTERQLLNDFISEAIKKEEV